MLTALIDHPLFLVLVTFILTLFGRASYSRWISQTSRVTREQCLKNQKLCQTEILLKLQTQGQDLECGDKHFVALDAKIWVITFALLKICNKLEIDCGELTKAMIEKGVLE